MIQHHTRASGQHLYSQLKDSRVHHIEWMLVTSKEICYKKGCG